jgi:hypothetical protein
MRTTVANKPYSTSTTKRIATDRRNVRDVQSAEPTSTQPTERFGQVGYRIGVGELPRPYGRGFRAVYREVQA